MSYQINTATTSAVSIPTIETTPTTGPVEINTSLNTSTTGTVNVNTNISTSTTGVVTIDTSLNTATTTPVIINPVGTVTITVSPNLLYYSVGSNVTVTDSTNSVNAFLGNINTYDSSTGVLSINQLFEIMGTYGTSVVYDVIVGGFGAFTGTLNTTVSANLLFYAPGNSITITDSTNPLNTLQGTIQSYIYATGELIVNQIQNTTGTFGTPVVYNALLTTFTSISLSITVSDGLIYYVAGNPVTMIDSTNPLNTLAGTIESYEYQTGVLVVNGLSSSGTFIVNVVFDLTVTPTKSELPITVATGLTSYTAGNLVTVVDSTNSSNYLNGNIQLYESFSGKMIIDNIQNINGSFAAAVVYNINLTLVIGGKLTITIPAGFTFYLGNSVYLSDSTNSSNNFAGFVEEYSFGTGSLTINNIQNINGTFELPVIYNVILSTPFPIQPTQAYKSVYEPIIPAHDTVSNPNHDYPRETAEVPSQNYGYSKFGWNTRTSLNNPVRGFSLGQSTSFTRHLSIPRRSSVLTNNVITIIPNTKTGSDIDQK